ncbi:hypothetical protein HMSSN036_62950 [Paenibacillus macerans]|nr:hypothetical protein HMSSN036_62950 [Paenibacillus macerans]
MKKKWLYGLLASAAIFAFPVSAYAAEGEITAPVLELGLNSLFVFVAAMLVFFMQAGFALLEAGTVRMKTPAT